MNHAERCNRKAEGIESGRVGESEASDQKGRNTRLALGRDAWAEEGDRYSFSRPQTDQLMDRGSSCVEYATPESLWTGIITFDNIDSSLHHTLLSQVDGTKLKDLEFQFLHRSTVSKT